MKFNPTEIFKDLAALFPMVKAVLFGKYKMPWGTFFWGVLCLCYLVSPIDILPDVLPLLGITDDGAFLLLVLGLIHKDLTAFRQQQEKNQNIIEAEIVPPPQNDKK